MIDVFVAGAQKAGTTALFEALAAHPAVQPAHEKELAWFVRDAVHAEGLPWLRAALPQGDCVLAAHAQALPTPQAPERLARVAPGAQVVVVLRDPVERAWSAFHFARRNGWEPLTDFEAAWDQQPTRLRGSERERTDLSYVHVGEYASHLARWRDRFHDRLHVVFTADLDVGALAADLGLDPAGVGALTRANPAATPRWRAAQRLLLSPPRLPAPPRVRRWLRRSVVGPLIRANLRQAPNPPMSPSLEQRLRAHYARHDEALADLVERPLPWTT